MTRNAAFRLGCITAFALTLPGCWNNPQPPSDNTADAYGWTVPLNLPGTEPYYRLPMSGDFSAWMTQHAVTSLAVFDAKGVLQACGPLSGETNHPLATMPQAIGTHITAFDDSVCGTTGRVCFKNQPCTVPDFCSPQTVDLTGTTLEWMTRPEQIVEAATGKLPPPPVCRPDNPKASRPCDEHDAAIRNALRSGEQLRMEALEFMANFGLLPETPTTHNTPVKSSATSESRGGSDLLITLDQIVSSPPMLTFRWNKPASVGRAGAATLTCYGNGSSGDVYMDVQGRTAENGDMVEDFWPSCVARTFRLVLKPNVPDLALVDVAATTYAPKPYMAPDVPQFWIAPNGTPPYALFLEPDRSGCGNGLNVVDVAKLPRAADPDWPQAANVMGLPVVHERGTWTKMLASRSDWLPWVYWLLYVGGACVAALLITLARWAWLAFRARPSPLK